MASGKPVVSTNFNPEILRELSDVVHTADYPEQLADFVLLAYATDSKQKREKRIYVASQNTWEQRAQLFSSYLAQELDVKHRLPYVT
jgi:glycosyltransferase involved in cell wall biosynthesis